MKNKLKAHFLIASNEINPDDISIRLGIKWDDAIFKGSPNASGNPESHPINLFILRSRLASTEDMEKHAIDILDRISPVRKKIMSLPKSCNPTMAFNCLLKTNGGWSFGVKTLNAIAKLGVPCVFSLDVKTRNHNAHDIK